MGARSTAGFSSATWRKKVEVHAWLFLTPRSLVCYGEGMLGTIRAVAAAVTLLTSPAPGAFGHKNIPVFLTTLEVSHYCNEGPRGCARCCGKWAPLNQTASGRPPVAGVTCAAPRRVPLGTWLYIEGIGRRRVDDRLSPRFDHRIDVFQAGHETARKLGVAKRRVWVVH